MNDNVARQRRAGQEAAAPFAINASGRVAGPPTDYAPEDSMANWRPELPRDFVRHYEAEQVAA